ncbi:MAG: DUF3300 domain-containing protein [Bryobacteraceae bacterium]
MWAQDQQYPPPLQYPTQQSPPPQQYPPQQSQYPPPQQQYPPQQYPSAQYPPPNAPPPLQPPQELDRLVSVIALYPDPLLAQVLTASTFSNEIPDAAGWAAEHQYLQGPQLAAAIQQDRVPWDPSVVALLPLPSVLQYMASNMGWTQQLGDAVLAQRGDVMDAVQRMRRTAYQYGYLRSGPYDTVQVGGPDDIQILPVNPGYLYVPYYNPGIVFVRPRAGFYMGGAIRFGPRIGLGVAFSPWGWGNVVLGWRAHDIVIGGRPWGRTWENRRVYVNRYEREPHYAGPRVERHDIRAHERGGNAHGAHERGHDQNNR